MAREDYTPYPTAQPQLAPTPKIREEFPLVQRTGAVGEALKQVGAGFGVLGRARQEVGDAFDRLGQSAKGAGNELWARAIALKQLDDDEKVNQTVLKTYQDLSKLGEKFRSQPNPGEEKLDAHLKEGQDVLTAGRDSLKGVGAEAQRKFDNETRGMFGRESSQSVQYTASQSRSSKLATFEAGISMLQDQASKATTNEEFDKATGKIIYRMEQEGRHLGNWDDERTGFETAKALTKAKVGYLSIRSDTDPFTVMNFLESKEGKASILDPAWSKLHDEVQAKIDKTVARVAGDKANQNPDLPLGEKLKIAEDEVKRSGHDTPETMDLAKSRTRSLDADNNRAKLSQTRKDKDLLEGFLAGFAHPEGKLPTKAEEIDVNPEAKAAYERLDNHDKRAFLGKLARNSEHDYAPTPETVWRTHQILGMSYDPAQLDKFRDFDVMAEHIPLEDKKKILAREREVAKNGVKAMEDPRVNSLIGVLKADGQLTKSFEQDEASMNAFKSRAHDQLLAEEMQKKRALSSEEQLRIGKTLLRDVPGTGIGGTNWWTSKTYQEMENKTYKSPSGTTFEQFSEKWKAAHGAAGLPADEEKMLQDWGTFVFKKEYEKFYGREGGAEPSTHEVGPKTTPKVPRSE